MSLKNFIYDYIIPPGVTKGWQSIKYREKKNTNQSNNHLFLTNQRFKDIHRGERCFILATGPSIKTQNLSPIYGETCIAVSHFHLHPDIKNIRPQYHVLAPPHPPFDFTDTSKYFKDFKKSYTEIIPAIFLGVSNYRYNYINLLAEYPELRVDNLFFLDYLNYISLDEHNYKQKDVWDISKTLFSQRTVLYGALQIAIYMGFSEIYLLGADHDYLNDTSRTTNHHFYAEERGISDKNHLEQFTSERWFYEYYMRWKQYRLIKEYCGEQGIKIYNSTEGGMLDVFERRALTEI